jgi:hypothetical protein
MIKYQYVIDDELRVVESPEGDKQLGMRRSVSAPSDALTGHVEAVREFEEGLEEIRDLFSAEIDHQESEIDKQVSHLEFFLNEKFKHHQWDFNQMFDRLRLLYVSQLDSLKREKRRLRIKRIMEGKDFQKELRDARIELSPFRKFF